MKENLHPSRFSTVTNLSPEMNDAMPIRSQEGETLQNALDEMEAKLGDQQKEHNKEIQDLR